MMKLLKLQVSLASICIALFSLACISHSLDQNQETRCLSCIRNVSISLATSDTSKRCETYFCGPYQISYNYWAEAGKPATSSGVRDHEKCARDRSCAEQTVRAYFKKFKRDCNNDGMIDCLDMAALHKGGPTSCASDWFYKSRYWLAFNKTNCISGNRDQTGESLKFDLEEQANLARLPAKVMKNQTLTSECLDCICDAVSGCNTSANNCGSGTVCGPFAISQSYWIDGRRPGTSWTSCTRTKECSSVTIKNYMEKHKKDCDGDGYITCEDYAAIHRRGPRACSNKDLLKDHYWNKFLACRANQKPVKDVNMVKVSDSPDGSSTQSLLASRGEGASQATSLGSSSVVTVTHDQATGHSGGIMASIVQTSATTYATTTTTSTTPVPITTTSTAAPTPPHRPIQPVHHQIHKFDLPLIGIGNREHSSQARPSNKRPTTQFYDEQYHTTRPQGNAVEHDEHPNHDRSRPTTVFKPDQPSQSLRPSDFHSIQPIQPARPVVQLPQIPTTLVPSTTQAQPFETSTTSSLQHMLTNPPLQTSFAPAQPTEAQTSQPTTRQPATEQPVRSLMPSDESEFAIPDFPYPSQGNRASNFDKVVIGIVGSPDFSKSYPPVPEIIVREQPADQTTSPDQNRPSTGKQPQQRYNTNHSRGANQTSRPSLVSASTSSAGNQSPHIVAESTLKSSLIRVNQRPMTTTVPTLPGADLLQDKSDDTNRVPPGMESLNMSSLFEKGWNDSAKIASECLECICDASSNCDTSVQCISKQREKNRCGMYMISWNQYQESDISLTSMSQTSDGTSEESTDEKMYYECTTDKICAERLIHLYIEKHQRDCNNDGKIDCYDIAAIHRVGPDSCNSGKFLSSQYWKDFNICYTADKVTTTVQPQVSPQLLH